MSSAGFTYRLDRLKPRSSKFRGPPAKVFLFEKVRENSDLKESLETMKKRYGTYGRNVS
jgi:hypothetical protein